MFVRASLHISREEKPTRCHWMVYCTYDTLNMFRALLCPSSGARECMCVITAYGVQCLVAGCRRSGAEQQAVSPEEGYSTLCSIPLLDSQPAACTWPPTTSNQALHTALHVVQHPSSGLTARCLHLTPTTSNQALHTIGGNNTYILELLMMGIEVPETCWEYYKCNKAFSSI